MPVFVKTHRRGKSIVKEYKRSERALERSLRSMGNANSSILRVTIQQRFARERTYHRRLEKVLKVKLAKSGRNSNFTSFQTRTLKNAFR